MEFWLHDKKIKKRFVGFKKVRIFAARFERSAEFIDNTERLQRGK
jgi:hypothetical protein